MDDLIYIYMITITIELILSVILGLILLAVLAPLGSGREADEGGPPLNPAAGRNLSPDVAVALRDAFDVLSRGGGDIAPLVHARHLLVKYQTGQLDEGGQRD